MKATEKQVRYFNGLYDMYYPEKFAELHEYGLKEYNNDDNEFELIYSIRQLIRNGKNPNMKDITKAIKNMKEYLF